MQCQNTTFQQEDDVMYALPVAVMYLVVVIPKAKGEVQFAVYKVYAKKRFHQQAVIFTTTLCTSSSADRCSYQ